MGYFDAPVVKEKFDSNPKVGERWLFDTGGVFRDDGVLEKKLMWGKWQIKLKDDTTKKISGADLVRRCAF